MSKLLRIKKIFSFLVMALFINACFMHNVAADDGSGFTMNLGGSATIFSGTVQKATAKAVGSKKLEEQADKTLQLGWEIATGSTWVDDKSCNGAHKCYPYCKYKKEYSSEKHCFLCPVFAIVFNTVSQVGQQATNAFSNSVVRVVIIGFAIWLALQILMFASSFETRDLKDLAQTIIAQGFIVILVVTILNTGVSNFFDAFISPVYETGQKMARTMFNACSNEEDATISGDASGKQCVSKKTSATEYAESPHIRRDIKKGVPAHIGDGIIQTMTSMENHVKKYKALGSGMACQSWKEGWFILPKFSILITGCAIWIFSMLIILGVPFLMIDSVFQLGVAVVLLPLAVGGFAFKSTRQYSKKVWETVLNSMFSFLFITVVVLLLTSVLSVAITDGVGDIKNVSGSFYDMFDPDKAETSKVFETIVANYSWAHGGFLKLAFTFILAWAMMGMSKEFASEMASSISNTSIGSDIGVMAASGAKGMVAPTAKRIGNKAFQGGINLTKKAVKFPRQTVKAIGRGASKGYMKWKQSRGKSAEYTDLLGRKHKLLDGGVEEITKTRRNGTNVKILRSRDVSYKTLKSANGKVKTKITLNSNRLDRMISEDGKVNMKLREKMLEGMSKEERKEFEKAINMKVAEKRFGNNLHNSKGAMKKEPEVVSYDPEKNEMVIKIVTAEGEVVLMRSKINEHGYMESEMIKADKKGNVTTLSTDGMRNRMSSARLSSLDDLQNLENLDEGKFSGRKVKNGKEIKFNNMFDDLLEKDNDGQVKKQTNYSYSKKMQHYIDRGTRPENIGFDENGNALGIMSMEEAVGEKIDNKWKTGDFEKFVNHEGHEFRKADMEINFRV